jgi:hypothetical protein
MKAVKKFSAAETFAIVFGIFLGLTIWKFGNPVILDYKISSPNSAADFWNDAWPLHWANWIFLPLASIGAFLVFQKKISWPQSKWLWLLPLLWLGWQFFSAVETTYPDLAWPTLWQFCGCVVSYFFGALIFVSARARNFLLIGIFAAFIFCLVRAVDQKLFEFPQNYQMLVQGEQTGWTNFPPETITEFKTEKIIISTNGTDIANPVFLTKFSKGRVAGTLVYPNALAGLIFLLWPAFFVVIFHSTKNLKSPIFFAAIGLAIFLGGAAFFWTGSKLGWLLALIMVGGFLLQLNFSRQIKFAAIAVVLIFGLGIFAVRFHNYFAMGATSVGARFDYWRAAIQTTAQNPLLGTGPGTFQRPYARIKSPEAEMARLAHNDYLEQFSDSGILGGLFYAAWIVFALIVLGKKFWHSRDIFSFAIFAGIFIWFAQGLGEFGLYVPALAWTAFTFLGCLLASNQFDKKNPSR